MTPILSKGRQKETSKGNMFKCLAAGWNTHDERNTASEILSGVHQGWLHCVITKIPTYFNKGDGSSLCGALQEVLLPLERDLCLVLLSTVRQPVSYSMSAGLPGTFTATSALIGIKVLSMPFHQINNYDSFLVFRFHEG